MAIDRRRTALPAAAAAFALLLPAALLCLPLALLPAVPASRTTVRTGPSLGGLRVHARRAVGIPGRRLVLQLTIRHHLRAT